MRYRLMDAPELLDEPHHDPHELAQSLDQVAEVNRLLGGRRAVLRALAVLVPERGHARILDVGTGSADIPLTVVAWAARTARDVHITATDLHPQMRQIAAARAAGVRSIVIEPADARALPYDDHSFDIVLLSLTLHHFDHADQQRALREAARVARRAVVVNELERCRANWYGARLLAATRWRKNRLTRHDGPLSVLRAFTRDELRRLVAQTHLRVERLERLFFFRLLLIIDARTHA